MENVLKVTLSLEVTNEDIDDIMCAALEGGITYWCDEARVVGEYLGEWAHEQISRGGTLILHDFEEDAEYELTREKFLDGLNKYIAFGCFDIIERKTNEYGSYTGKLGIDVFKVDAVIADAIVQFAVFGDWIYG